MWLTHYDHQLNPFSPACATFLAELCNPIIRQAIELESCSNPLRIKQVLKSKSKKQIFVLGLSFSGGNVSSRGVFCVFILAIFAWPWAPSQWAIFGLKI